MYVVRAFGQIRSGINGEIPQFSEQMRLRDKLIWRFHVQGQMRALSVIVSQELISPLLGERQVLSLAAQRTVEALDESLVVLPVRAGDHMHLSILADLWGPKNRSGSVFDGQAARRYSRWEHVIIRRSLK